MESSSKQRPPPRQTLSVKSLPERGVSPAFVDLVVRPRQRPARSEARTFVRASANLTSPNTSRSIVAGSAYVTTRPHTPL